MNTLPNEARVLTACLRYLKRRGVFAWRNSVGAYRAAPGRWITYGLRGSADIEGVLPSGRFLAVECKAAKGRLSPEQHAFLARVRELGGLALCVHSLRELDEALRASGAVSDGELFDEEYDPETAEKIDTKTGEEEL